MRLILSAFRVRIVLADGIRNALQAITMALNITGFGQVSQWATGLGMVAVRMDGI